MNHVLHELLELLRLEQLEVNLFRGQSRDIVGKRVFGGQVLGQALVAASHTVEGRTPHSLHAYFLRAGDAEAPIVYDVDRARDGRSFTARRVVAIQHGRPILNLAASFHQPEPGVDHQIPVPEVPGPEELKSSASYQREVIHKVPEKLRRLFLRAQPFEFRPVEVPDFLHPRKLPPHKFVWFKTVDRLPDESDIHHCLLAYVSDYELFPTALLPHALSFLHGNVQLASLDHAMWFHRPCRVDEWLLYAIDSPSASGARGLARGSIFDRHGMLVASTAQEGLVRVWPEAGSEDSH